MGAPDLTETTIRYLFATEWLPSDPADRLAHVPGGSTTGLDTGANLLHIAMWALRRQGLMEFEQLRPVEDEPVRVLGAKSFSAFRLHDPDARRPGLEGALLAAAAASDDDHGVRRVIQRLGLDDRAPWRTICSHCFHEAHAAGLVDVKGRIFRNVVITNEAAVESLRERHDELRAARGTYLDADPELTTAVMSDCLRVVADAFNPGGGD